MAFDDLQRLQAVLPDDGGTAQARSVCPFADGLPNEDRIAAETFLAPEMKDDERLGRYLATYGGWVEEGDFRARASSGGLGSWLQAELLQKGLVDAVLDVTAVDASPGGAPLFRFTVARTLDEIRDNAKTRYYPVEMSGVIAHMRNVPGRYAVIGVPCFAKALRLIARQDVIIAERLRFVLSIVCGHLKSAAFAEAIAWQMGVKPTELTGIDFRTKLEGRRASRYGATVSGVLSGNRIVLTSPMEGLVGANWGHGLFKLKGCEFCDDVLGETADAVVGDAWLPAYDEDARGANVLILRNPVLLDLVSAAAAEDRLHLDPLSADEVAASQAGGLRHRRDGLAYRLWLADRTQQWRPAKRVKPRRDHLDPTMRRIHRMRFELGQKSHALFRLARDSGDLGQFIRAVEPLIADYERQMKPGLTQRVINLLYRKTIRIVKHL